MLTIPKWGLWLMFASSVAGSVMLGMQLAHIYGWQ